MTITSATPSLTPRPGLPGMWDQIVGPQATTGETIGTLVSMLLGGIAAPLSGYLRGFAWNPWQYVVLTIMGIDLIGGLWANATLATRRWYHRPGQGWLDHLGFTALHIYPFFVAWLFRGGDWGFAIGNYAALLFAVLIVTLAPKRIQQPIANVLFVGVLLANTFVWAPTPGVEWFIPVLFLKTLVGHAPTPLGNGNMQEQIS